MTNEPIILCNVILRAWFVSHRYYLEQTKTFVPGFVFGLVLAHEKAITKMSVTAELISQLLDTHLSKATSGLK